MKNLLFTLVLITSAATLVFAQSPGGVAGAGTNQLWLDANQLTLSNNDAVVTWTDKSGKGNNAVSNGSTPPTFKTNQINGLPAIQFDGVDDRLRTFYISALNTNTITSFAVFSSSATSGGMVYRYAYESGAGTTSSYYLYGLIYNPITSQLTYQEKKSDGSNILIVKNSYSGNLTLTSQIWNATSSFSAKHDGASVSSVAGSDASPGANAGISLGANYITAPVHLKMVMAEKIAYSSALSSAEVNIVENYLGAKYGIAIGNDMYAYDATAGFDLIGIGQESDGNNLSAKGISPLGLNVGSLANGDYIITGHDNAGYSSNSTDVPAAGYARFNQVWRTDVTGTPGLITVTFDVSTYGLGGTSTYKLLVDADGVFTTTSFIYGGSYSSGTVTFANVALPAGYYFTLANSNGLIKSTGTTTDWHTTTTWDCGCVPTAGMTVEVQTGHTVDINGQNAAVANLTVNGTLTFSASDTLSILSNLTNNSVFTAGTGTVLLNGTAAQTLTGTLALNNLKIDNAAGVTNAGTLSIGAGGFLDVQAGALATGNALTLISNSSGTGALANPTTGSITGSFAVQRYLNEGTNGNSWYLLAPGVIGGNLEDWNQEFEMAGFTGTDWLGGSPSVYYYDQNNIVSSFNDGYTVPSNTADVISNTVGYDLYVGDDSYATGPRTINITGTPALGAVAIPAPHVVKLGTSDDGWTLMANPYASPVLWSDVQKSTNYDNAYRRLSDGTSGVLYDWVKIAVGEAIWVHSDVGGATITFDPTDVNATNVDLYNARMAFANANPTLVIRLLEGSTQLDKTELGFNENALDSREKGVDAYKLNTAVPTNPNISTVVDGSDFCRNILNMNTNTIVPIRVYTKTPSQVSKNYTLDFNNIEAILQHNKRLILEDRENNTFTTLNGNVSIPFAMMDNVTAPRFFLHITSPLTIEVKNVTCNGANNGSIAVSSTENGALNYVVKNENHQVIRQNSVVGEEQIQNLTAGKYTIEATNSNNEQIVATVEITEPSITTSAFEMYSSVEETELLEKGAIFEAKVGEEINFHNLSGDGLSSWDFGDLTTSNNKNDKHMYLSAGDYAVNLKVKNATCEVNSTQTLRILPKNNGQTNLLNNLDVIVIENEIIVSLNNELAKEVSFSIYNSVGQVVFSKDVKAETNHQERIKLNVSNGVYLVTVKDDKGTKTKKIVLSNK